MFIILLQGNTNILTVFIQMEGFHFVHPQIQCSFWYFYWHNNLKTTVEQNDCTINQEFYEFLPRPPNFYGLS